MEAKEITLHSITPDELLANIRLVVSDAIKQAKKEVPKQEENLSTGEAMELLNCSKTTLWKWCKEGRIRKHGLGRKIYYKRSEILSAIQLIKQ